MASISVEHVSLTIGAAQILRDISVQFEAGEIHGIAGRNGSGKTMLMKCICGFIRPTAGRIVVDGNQVGRDVDFPPDLGLLIETPGFIPYYSGLKNLELLAAVNRRASKERLNACMELVGLGDAKGKRVSRYSMGMRQRLGIAQAIMEDPQLLILDEPLNGLDEQGVEDIRALLLELKGQGKTILLSSHNGEDIDLLCDSVCKMAGGVLTKQ
ncbi:ATP-binding cassette domain-containing protein [Pseudoflavonifractor sp. 60]|uniref:ABC transporter ATP-binding protein n=1 Tax=Pseudoflavonifractor sp. 60 TaxID=2304576 RepID=UPI0013718772|nr:ATP-binding cassette domain-containing protein [Pseudoflavonifractor sp. 60]NBI68487.1 ATP-binding cassette domain-containing protein [Pseudoflavonifractor sp. 60]